MKQGPLTLAMILIGGYALAQTSTAPKVTYGLKAGVNFAQTAITGTQMEDDVKDDAKSITSFQFGAYADVPLSGTFSIQPGITLSGKGGKVQLSETGTQLGPPAVTGKMKSDIMYLEVPVSVVYKVNGFYLGGGPYAAVALSGKHESELTYTATGQTIKDERNIKFGHSGENDFKRSDFGMNLLGGYELKSGFNIGVNYGIGLSDLNPSEGSYNYQNRVASMFLGFKF